MEEIKIVCAVDCGNAPKKILLRDFAIALVKSEFDACLPLLRDDVNWNIIGKKQIQGKDNVKDTYTQLNNHNIKELEIHNIITHGNTASLNATIIRNNQDRIEFCDVYQFDSFGKKAKLKTITSYVIHT